MNRELELLVEGYSRCKCEKSKQNQLEAIEALFKEPQKTAPNSDYAGCADEIIKYIEDSICDEGVGRNEIMLILKKHTH